MDMLAAASIFYYQSVPTSHSKLVKGVTIVYISIATFLAAMMLVHTILMLVKRRLFVPEDKWGPLSFMRISHYAFRGGLKKLKRFSNQIVALNNDEAGFSKCFEQLIEYWTEYLKAHQDHSKQEDKIFFPAIDSYLPNCSKSRSDEHEHDRKFFEECKGLLKEIKNAENPGQRAPLVQKWKDSFTAFRKAFKRHLIDEEIHTMGPVVRKFIPIKVQRKLAQKIWEKTKPDHWRSFIRFAMINLPTHSMRVRFLKSLQWSLPGEVQKIGIMLYEGVPREMYIRITEELTELVPHGQCYHIQYR